MSDERNKSNEAEKKNDPDRVGDFCRDLMCLPLEPGVQSLTPAEIDQELVRRWRKHFGRPKDVANR